MLCTTFLSENLMKTDHLEQQVADGGMCLKEICLDGLDWIQSAERSLALLKKH
jgi:hypothetical protein